MDQRPPASAYAAAVGMTIAFGLSFVATKTALKGFEPLLLALLRFALAGGILWVVWRLRPVREPVTRGSSAGSRSSASSASPSTSASRTLGIARTSASEAAILIATIPIFVALIWAFPPAERPSGRQWAGILLSFAGIVALVLAAGGAGGGSLTGNLLVLAASVSAGVYSILARSLLLSRSALFVTAWQNLFGALFMAPLALVEALVLGVRRPTRTGGRRRAVPHARLLDPRVPHAQLRVPVLAGEPGERVHQPDADRRRGERVRRAGRAADRGAGRGRGRGGGGRVADEQREARGRRGDRA